MATLNQYLISIGQEMAAQDNRGTQYPMFLIMDSVRRYTSFTESWEFKTRNPDYEGQLCPDCTAKAEAGQELPDNCEVCDYDAFDYYNLESTVDVNPGIFFTASACQHHIDTNRHHYTEPTIYGISAWRNPEMQAVQKHLIKLAKRELPSHYA